MHLTVILFTFGVVHAHANALKSVQGSRFELQTSYLNSIYEAAKGRSLVDGELNLLKNDTTGFANAVLSFAEKGQSNITKPGNKEMMFDLSSLAEPNKQVVKIVCVMKYSALDFQMVKHLNLYMQCASCTHQSEIIAQHDITEADVESEWLELTMECVDCVWNEVAQVSLTLQMTDENNVTVPCNEEFFSELTPFLVLYMHNEMFPEEIIKALEKRETTDNTSDTKNFNSSMNQVSDNSTISDNPTQNSTEDQVIFNHEIITLKNRTTVDELERKNSSCSVETIFLTPDEIGFEGTVIGSGVTISFCFGLCDLPSDILSIIPEDYTKYFRTRLMMHALSQEQGDYPSPSCIPAAFTTTLLISIIGDIVKMEAIPLASECMCLL